MKIECTKNFHMEDGDCVFTSGNTYEFTLDDLELDEQTYWAIDDQGDVHYMTTEDLEELTA